MLEVVKAEYKQRYKLWIEFNDGRSGIVDLEVDLWGPVFEPLRDKERFKRFHISKVLHTISWDNEADFAPEHLYKRMANKRMRRAS